MKGSRPIQPHSNEASRKLYKAVGDAVHKLEQHFVRSSNVSELLSPKTTDLRMRLKDYCIRLIFSDPLEYGKKAEDVLWRRVFYDFFLQCKQDREGLQESVFHQKMLRSHLVAGIGTYHDILLRIQTEFHVNLEGDVEIPFLWNVNGVKKERWKRYQQSNIVEDRVKSWALRMCHQILVHLGDLERYAVEMDSPENVHLAERCYLQAFCMNHQNGTPHNQLGSLYSFKFDAAYYYMRCMASDEKFEGVEKNLVKVFDRNNEMFEHDDGGNMPRLELNLLKLCQIFYFSSGETAQYHCQPVLRDFSAYASMESSSEFYDCSNVFRVIVMALMCMSHLEGKSSEEISTATAFNLALFSHVVHLTTDQLISSIYKQKFQDIRNDSGNSETNLNSSLKSGSKGRFQSPHLRRRKISNDSQEDSDLSDESDEFADSDNSQSGSESLSDDETFLDQNDHTNLSMLSADKLIKVLSKNNLLPCLKILTDWLRANNAILTACAESSQCLLSRLIELLNILLKVEDKLASLAIISEKFSKLKQSDMSRWVQRLPLPEDIVVRGLTLLKKVHSHMHFEASSRRKLSRSSQVFLRIQCLLSFGKCLSVASDSSVAFDEKLNKYYFNLCSEQEQQTSIETVNYKEEGERQKLMQSMAHLWLKSEVNTLEVEVEGAPTQRFSPYLVADTTALCQNTTILKQIINSKAFVVVIPLVVLFTLDQMKKDNIAARDTIRWLELQLKSGCRHIRPQRKMEKISLVPMKYPKRKDKDAWDFYQILECCNYLAQHRGNENARFPVTLLVGIPHNMPENANALANSIDVNIDDLMSFYSKWNSSKKNANDS